MYLRELILKKRGFIEKYNEEYSLPRGYLITQLGLHLPRFSHTKLLSGEDINKDILKKDAKRLAARIKLELESLPAELYKAVKCTKNKGSIISKDGKIFEFDGQKHYPVEAKKVNTKTGFLIQDKLHYLKNKREDTLLHYGLFRENEKYPFSYVSYSLLDRQYLYKCIPVDWNIKFDEVIYLSRFFSVNNNPYNSTSVLISRSIKQIKKLYPNIKAIITTINPNVFFSGASFLASNFKLIGYMPFVPKYFHEDYITRKTLNKDKIIEFSKPDKLVTKMLYPNSVLINTFESKTAQTDLFQISERDYENG